MLICPRQQVHLQIPYGHLPSQLTKNLGHYIQQIPKQAYYYLYWKTMNKKKYKQKPTIFEYLLSQQINYPTIYYADSLYPSRLHLLKSNEFKGFIKHITKHLSPLLFINQTHFFTLMEKNLSIRTSLQSCLASFPRRMYGRLFDSRQQTKDISKVKDQSYSHYSLLMKIVLFILYRISTASSKSDKQLVYDEFLLDIPKLLDIAAIYGQSNPQIVTKLISNAYALHPSYDRDTIDFFNHVQRGKMEQMQRNKDTDIDFSPQSLKAQNYGNREKYMIQKVMLVIFTVKDTLMNLTNFLKYFPKKYVYQLATDYKLQERLIDGVTFFTNQMNYGWNLGDYKQKYFALHFQDMRQAMVVYFIQEFKVLKEVIQGKQDASKEFEEYAHNTYQTFCLLLQTKKKPYYKEYVKLIHNLIEESEEDIFFLSGDNIYKSVDKKKKVKVQKTQSAIQFCQKYQQNYRKKNKKAESVDYDSILNKNRENMKKFKEIWISPSERKRQQIAKERQEKYRRIEDHELNSYINSLKYGGKDKQYDDQPEQQEFNRIALPNQYQKLDKMQLNLSFKIKDPKKVKCVPKQHSNSYNQADLSFNLSRNKQNNKNDLSFTLNQSKLTQSNLDLSICQPQQTLDDLNISRVSFKLNEFTQESLSFLQNEQFQWNNDSINSLQELQNYFQKVNNQKKMAVQQDLSF